MPATPADVGAGRIDPNRAADPGLVLNETPARFREFAAGLVPTRDPTQPTVDPTDLNLPGIVFDPIVGPRSTRRTFTSVDPEAGVWQASVEGVAGIGVTVDPAPFSIASGESHTVQFSFDPAGAPTGSYVYGAVVLTHQGDGRTVRLPVVLRPEEFEAPEQLNFGAGAAGSAPLPVPTGYQGQLSALGYGFARPETHPNQTVGQDDTSIEQFAQPGPGVTVFDLQVPPGAQMLAAELNGAFLSDPLADPDLHLFHDDEGDGFDMGDLVDSSETSSIEVVLLRDPAPGAYRVSVRGFEANPVATFDLTTWLINDPAPDVLSDPLGPGLQIGGDQLMVLPGGIADFNVEWQGLDEPGVYLGLITYHNTATPDPDAPLGETILAITRSG